MRGRSLAAALALAFGATTLAVFVLVGSFLYVALEKQIKAQDNLEIVLAARHARRLAQELDTVKGIREHGDRLTSTVLGNEAMSMAVFGPDGNRVVEHNIAATFAAPYAENKADTTRETSATSGVMVISALPPLRRIPASTRIIEA
ncbi:two-component sensor histidine kinase, partial [Paraburkholderia sp. RL18-101-BIB-B]